MLLSSRTEAYNAELLTLPPPNLPGIVVARFDDIPFGFKRIINSELDCQDTLAIVQRVVLQSVVLAVPTALEQAELVLREKLFWKLADSHLDLYGVVGVTLTQVEINV